MFSVVFPSPRQLLDFHVGMPAFFQGTGGIHISQEAGMFLIQLSEYLIA